MATQITITNEKILTDSLIRNQKHPFHIVDPSPWAFTGAFGAFFTVFGVAMYVHFYQNGYTMLKMGLTILLATAFFWWRDVVREATYEGNHTTYVKSGLKFGMILFIVSEIMLFFAFFWAFFHSSLSPVLEIGAIWPPKGIDAISPWHVPLLNTFVLLNSGAFVTWAHYSLLAGFKRQTINGLIYTIILAAFFTVLQGYEYVKAPFNISDGIYGSVFFMTTGLHGFHVIIGTIFLIVCFYRLLIKHFTPTTHIGMECAIWYWHFVDVVWIFVFFFIYYWGFSYYND